MSLLAMFQKQNVKRKSEAFVCDHFGQMWECASEEHKRLLLRVAFLQDQAEPKHWGAYSKQEQRTLHQFGLWLEEFADFQRVVKKKSMAFEKRINAPD